MTSINSLTPPIVNQTFIPNDRQNQNNMINDFKNTLFNTDGEFLKWNFNGSLNSKYNHTLFVKQGSIKYENGFVLAQNIMLQYNLTNNLP
jgi:antitoxin component YwqK of YwqJK toxin-antitoxin module